jgi:hypothetical protein
MVQLFVKNLQGKTLVIDIELTDTILDLKQKVLVREGIDYNPSSFHLYKLYKYTNYSDTATLLESGLEAEHNLRLVFREKTTKAGI